MQTPSTNQLLNLARELRATCKENQWDDLRSQIDALLELQSRDHLISGLDMIQTAIECRTLAIKNKHADISAKINEGLKHGKESAEKTLKRRLVDDIRIMVIPRRDFQDPHANTSAAPSATEPTTPNNTAALCRVCGGRITHGINGFCSFVCAMESATAH